LSKAARSTPPPCFSRLSCARAFSWSRFQPALATPMTGHVEVAALHHRLQRGKTFLCWRGLRWRRRRRQSRRRDQGFADGAPGSEIHVAVAPKPGDVVVTKHRVSAFAGTDLEMVLRANGIEALVLAGLATSGVVLSTLRHAADADYRILVVEDCCADRDPEVHRVLMEKVFTRQATVVRAEAVQAGLSS
jgi:nicotinamidase-related amidase